MAIRPSDRFLVFARDDFTCRYCGRSAPDVPLHVDHKHPRSRGGSDRIANLVTACQECNSGKGARVLPALTKEARASMRANALAACWVYEVLAEIGDGSEREFGHLSSVWFQQVWRMLPGDLGAALARTREWALSTPHPRPPASDYLGDAISGHLYSEAYTGKELPFS